MNTQVLAMHGNIHQVPQLIVLDTNTIAHKDIYYGKLCVNTSLSWIQSASIHVTLYHSYKVYVYHDYKVREP